MKFEGAWCSIGRVANYFELLRMFVMYNAMSCSPLGLNIGDEFSRDNAGYKNNPVAGGIQWKGEARNMTQAKGRWEVSAQSVWMFGYNPDQQLQHDKTHLRGYKVTQLHFTEMVYNRKEYIPEHQNRKLQTTESQPQIQPSAKD